MYANGSGVKRDLGKAFTLMTEATNLGCTGASSALADIFDLMMTAKIINGKASNTEVRDGAEPIKPLLMY